MAGREAGVVVKGNGKDACGEGEYSVFSVYQCLSCYIVQFCKMWMLGYGSMGYLLILTAAFASTLPQNTMFHLK